MNDLRYAVRALLKTSGFTAITIATVAVAIGANSCIFNLIDVLLLRKLQVRAPDELVQISLLTANGGRTGLSLPVFEEMERRQQVFSGMLLYVGGGAMAVQAGDGYRVANIWAVGGNFHEELGQAAVIGRLLTPADVDSPVAFLGYRFWVRHFAASTDALGRTITVEGVPFTIAGVTQPGFGGLGLGEDPEVTIPLNGLALAMRDSSGRPLDLRNRRRGLSVAARLKNGVTIEQASAHLELLRPQLLAPAVPEDATATERDAFVARRFDVRSAATGIETFLRTRFTQPLAILLGIAGLTLLIACAHLAGLMLARAAARSREIAVMLALGATRWRIARQTLVEGLLLSLGGAVVGLLFARWSSQVLADFMTARYAVPPRFDFAPDATVLGVSAALAVATGLLFSLAPVWFTTRTDPAGSVRQHGAGRFSAVSRIGRTLIVTQVALTMALITTAALLARSVEQARSGDAGFSTGGVLIAGLRAVPGGYQRFEPNTYYRELLDRVKEVSEVRAASVSKERPANFSPQRDTVWPLLTGGDERNAIPVARFTTAPGLFDVLNIPLTRGRDFVWTDDHKGPRVAILSRGLAERLFGTVDCIGQRIYLGTGAGQSAEVVGIVGDARMFDPRQPPPFIVYVPAMEQPQLFLQPMLAVRADSDLGVVQAAVSRAIDALGREYVTSMETMNQVVDASLVAERLSARLTGFFALVALALAAIGLFSLMSYVTTRRTHEIGIRLALGANPQGLTLAVIRDSITLVTLGVAIGVPLAIVAARAIASILIGVSALDAPTLAVVSFTLLAVGAAAGYGPARRASRVDPMVALRCE